MVRIFLILAVAANVFAASGGIAAQAKKYFTQGRYEAAYNQYSLALKEAHKEADLVAEGRILISMAILASHAMQYEDAKKLLDMVRVNDLDEKSRESFYMAYMEFYNLQGKYRESFDIANRYSFKKPTAAFSGEAAIAAAGSRNGGEADAHLKKINKKDSPGQLAFYKARVADLNGESPKELYEKALKISTDKKRFFVSGIILLRLAEITGNKDYAARSAAVFKELGLAEPFKKAEGAAK
ncbi:MAG: hypothetical protein FWC15_02470 [Fibromonadales bacterium]|nr:hypothetical protein [Fibromonadales bacterium]